VRRLLLLLAALGIAAPHAWAVSGLAGQTAIQNGQVRLDTDRVVIPTYGVSVPNLDNFQSAVSLLYTDGLVVGENNYIGFWDGPRIGFLAFGGSLTSPGDIFGPATVGSINWYRYDGDTDPTLLAQISGRLDASSNPLVRIYVSSTRQFSVENGGLYLTGPVNITNGYDVVLGTTTGTKFGTSTSQKLAFFNATPIVQPANTTDLRTALVNLGLLASGGATPLDLNGGDATVNDLTVTGTCTGCGGGTSDHGALTGLTDDDHPQYLKLGGRTGMTNDPTLSSDGQGSLYGSGGTSGLSLNANTSSSVDGFTFNRLNANTSVWNGFNMLLSFGVPGSDSATLTLNDVPGMFPAIVAGYLVSGDWTVGDDSMGGPTVVLFRLEPTIHNPPGVAKAISNELTAYGASPTYLSDGAACTANSLSGHGSRPTFTTTNGGTLAVNAWVDYSAGPAQIDSGVTLSRTVGFEYSGATGGGSISGDNTAYACDDGDIPGGTGTFSLKSTGPVRQLVHAGPVKIGDTSGAMITNPSVVLELAPNTQPQTLLLSRSDDSGEAGMTTEDAMFFYNTDHPHAWPFRGYDTAGGGWRSFVMDDGAGNVVVTGGSASGYLDLGEFDTTNDPGTPASGRGRLYLRDNGSGKVQLAVLFPSGAAQAIATEP
jgi:hypothetical protein